MQVAAMGMKFAYADPPYVGQANKHYKHEESYAGEVDHTDLLCSLKHDYPDGWALSCSSPSLQELLWICHQIQIKPRIAAWVKPFASFKPGVNPAYAWEPVLFMGGRKRDREEDTVRDWMRCNITLMKGLSGVKPEPFSHWVFQLLGVEKGDELVDLYPGSGAVGRAFNRYQERML